MQGSQPSLQFRNKSRVRASGTTVSADDSMQVQMRLTHRWHSHDTYSATGGQTLEKELLAGKASRQDEGESDWMGDVPRAEITQIFPVKILQQSAFMFASAPSF